MSGSAALLQSHQLSWPPHISFVTALSIYPPSQDWIGTWKHLSCFLKDESNVNQSCWHVLEGSIRIVVLYYCKRLVVDALVVCCSKNSFDSSPWSFNKSYTEVISDIPKWNLPRVQEEIAFTTTLERHDWRFVKSLILVEVLNSCDAGCECPLYTLELLNITDLARVSQRPAVFNEVVNHRLVSAWW